MTEQPSSPRYLLKPSALELTDEVARAVAELRPESRALALEHGSGGLPDGGGWLIIPPGLSQEASEELMQGLVESDDAWGLLLLQARPEGVRVVPLTPGYPESPDRIAERLVAGGLEGGFVEHRLLLDELARIRHDVNNALTSALAEAQFLRMDAEEGTEIAGGLALVERQLQRIREITAELGALRVTSP